MDRSEVLLAVAQVALGLAGFGGVFVALSRDAQGARQPANAYRLVLLQSSALATLMLSLLPIGFESIGYDPAIGKVSLVGAGMRSHPGVSATFFRALTYCSAGTLWCTCRMRTSEPSSPTSRARTFALCS